MSQLQYRVQTEVFEGPLELLLTLIEKRKLLINDISLAAVTDDFISHVERGEGVPVPERAHFVLVASTLLLIKSKSLLPTLALTEEEKESVEDLELRLKLYKQFRTLAAYVQERYGKHVMYAPSSLRPFEPVFAPGHALTLKHVRSHITHVLQELPKTPDIPKVVVEKVMSLEAMIEHLTERVAKNLRMSFGEFAQARAQKKMHVIVSFLAMLELVKQGAISVSQDALFSDITMESDNISTPRYS